MLAGSASIHSSTRGAMIQEIPTFGNAAVTRSRWEDPQYGAAFYLFAHEPRAFDYVTPDGIEKETLLAAARTWSTTEQILIKVALDLFDPMCVRDAGFQDASAGEIAGSLDGAQFRAVVKAIQIARGSLSALDQITADRD